MSKMNVAVVGYGWWGKTIVRTLAGSAAVKVAMVVEPDNGDALYGHAWCSHRLGREPDDSIDQIGLCQHRKPHGDFICRCTEGLAG